MAQPKVALKLLTLPHDERVIDIGIHRLKACLLALVLRRMHLDLDVLQPAADHDEVLVVQPREERDAGEDPTAAGLRVVKQADLRRELDPQPVLRTPRHKTSTQQF